MEADGGASSSAAAQPASSPPAVHGSSHHDHHTAALQAFERQQLERAAAWDRGPSLAIAAALMATEGVLIWHAAPAWHRGAWLACCLLLDLAELLLLLAPAAAYRWLYGGRLQAYLRRRTALILASRIAALAVVAARTAWAWDAITNSHVLSGAGGGLTTGMLVMVHGLRLLLASQLHQLPGLAAVALQAVSVAGVCFGVADTCATWAPFTHRESRVLFAATAARLDEYAVWAALPAAVALGPPATLLLRSVPAVGAASSDASFCWPVFFAFELAFGFVLPLCYAAGAAATARRRFLAATCRCGACSGRDTLPHGGGYAHLALTGLAGPALLWSAVVALAGS